MTDRPMVETGASLDAAVPSDPLSAMSPTYNFVFRWFARRYFEHFELGESTVARLRELESRGAVVYVMRYSSRLDYFLFNTLFHREGLRLSSFANGLHYYYYRPWLQALRLAFRRPRGRPGALRRSDERDFARDVVQAGGSFFLFLRTARFKAFLRGRRRPRQDELDLLHEVVKAAWDADRPVSIVPLSVFWRKGPRSESRFLNLSYGALTRPSDLLKVTSFLAQYRGLSVKCGEAIDLTSFVEEQRAEGRAQVARKVRRSILTYLYREEKVVEGPVLRSVHRVGEIVLGDPGVQAAIRERAVQKRGSLERATADAEKAFREIAANMNSTVLAVLGAIVGWIVRRMFASIEVDGLDVAAEAAKRHPIVLVPSHRSYFDFVIMSWLFYQNYLVPPHIAARENMAFGPFGFLFRRVGAFFLRSSFDDPLYKEVFRAYVAYLVREGLTQEFFIEGGRSRSGKTLAPRLGMLSWDVDAFLSSSRRDLLFVPVGITYERLVEEGAMVDELEGGSRTQETVLGLVRARKFLQRRFGSVHLAFGQPISLAAEIGERRAFLADEENEAAGAERRRFVEALGQRIVERINWAAVANATSVASCVALAQSHRGLRRSEFVVRMGELLDLLRLQGARITPALRADDRLDDAIAFMLRMDLLRSAEDPGGEILYFEEGRRRALDLYRNTIVQFLAGPSLLARALLSGGAPKELQEQLGAWQDLFSHEFYAPRAGDGPVDAPLLMDHFERRGWILRSGECWGVTDEGAEPLRFLAAQTRGVIEVYLAAATACVELEDPVDRKTLLERCQERLDAAQLLGEARHPECAHPASYQNAIDHLVRSGMLERRPGEAKPARRGGPPGDLFARGEAAEALSELRRRLAAALHDR